jgi:hypothetical protein
MNKLDKLIEWMQDEIKDYEETMPSRSFTRSKVVLALTDCINKAKKLQLEHAANKEGWVSKSLYVKETLTDQVFKVWKYIESNDGEVSVWCNDWYGRHVIGQDCEFTTPPTDQ